MINYLLTDKELIPYGFNTKNPPYINIIIDGMNLFIRQFKRTYGIMNDNYNRDTGGLFISLKNIFNIISNYESEFPNCFYNIVFEKGKSQTHKETHKEYKQNRKIDTSAMSPEELKDFLDEKENFKNELETLKEIMGILSYEINPIHVYYQEGDFVIRRVIAEYQNFFDKNNMEQIHLIFSSDNDFKQLLSPEMKENIMIFDTNKKKIITRHNYETYYEGIPEEILFQKILVGDKSDNIFGIRGIGKKKAKIIIDSIKNDIHGKLNKEDLTKILQEQKLGDKLKNLLTSNIDLVLDNFKMVNIIDIENVNNMLSIKTIHDIMEVVGKYISNRLEGNHTPMLLHKIMKVMKHYNLDSFCNQRYLSKIKTKKITT